VTAAATALMNRIYRRQRHIYDVTRRYYLLGRDLLIDRLAPAAGDRVLEIGCGTGRNLTLGAQRYPEVRWFGIDVSTEMLTSAIEAIARARLSSRVRVAHADATAFDPDRLFRTAQFERVFISYSLSMIPAWPAVLDRAITHLTPGGELHVVDFGGQQGLPCWFRGSLRRWLALFHVAPRDNLEEALAAKAHDLGATLAVERLYRDYAQYARLTLPYGN
jgi:S-adenosylmethionine-diacylgycerolhomoserine-N-methlytransferase